jgi:hypothetical protein
MPHTYAGHATEPWGSMGMPFKCSVCCPRQVAPIGDPAVLRLVFPHGPRERRTRLLRFEASHGRARTSRDGWPQLRTGVALQGGQALAFDLPDGGNREERSLAGKVSGR